MWEDRLGIFLTAKYATLFPVRTPRRLEVIAEA